MPAILANAKNFLFTTDYPTDKVVWTLETSYNVPQTPDMSSSFYQYIPHTFSNKIMIIGSYSVDNWATSYEIGDGKFRGAASWSADASCDSTRITIHAVTWDAPRTFSFRLIGLAPYDGTTYVKNSITNTNSGFIYDTDFNYLKLIQSGKVSVSATGSNQTLTIQHNLGYVPVVYVFVDDPGTGQLFRSGNEGAQGVTGVQTEASVNTSQLNIVYSCSFNETITLHYRIYADG